MAVVRNLLIRAGADFGTAKKSMQQFQKDTNSFKTDISNSMKGIQVAIASAITAIAGMGIGAAVQDAIKFEAAIGQLNRMLGSSADEFRKWADEQAGAFGLGRSQAVQFGATYANLISGFSSSTEETFKRTQDLLKASAVVASSTGRSMEDVMDRIRSGLLGETDAIEDLGINVNIAMIESTDAFKKFANGKHWAQLDFNTQQQIRLFAIMEQAAKKYGTEITDNTASRQAQFIAQLKNTQLALGQAFLPIYNAVLPALTKMAAALANAMNAIAGFMSALFGTKVQQQQTKATQQQASAVSGLGDAYEEAGKQAKNSVAGFDEINQLSESGGGAGGGSGAGTSAAAAAPVEISQSQEATSKFAEMAAKFKEVMQPVIDAFGRFKEALRELGTSLKELWGALDGDKLTGWLLTIGAYGWAAFFDRLTGLAEILTGVATAIRGLVTLDPAMFLKGIEKIGSGLYDTFVVGGIGALIPGSREKLIELKGVIANAWEQIKKDAMPVWNAIGITIQWLWQNVLVPFGQWLGTALVAAWGAVATAAQWLWKSVLVPLGNFLLWMWGNVFTPLSDIALEALKISFLFVADVAKMLWQEVLVPLATAMKESVKPAVEALSTVFAFLWNNVLKPFGAFLSVNLKPAFQGIVDVMKFLWENVAKPLAEYMGGSFKTIFSEVFKTLGELIEDLKTAFKGLMTFITGVFTVDWRKAWEGVRDIFKGIFDGLYDLVKFPLNLIIDAINKVIGGLNSISISVPDWVPEFGGKSFGVHIGTIPRLARGGVVSSPTVAMLGEAGAEAVVPLERGDVFDKFAGAISTAVMTAMQTVGGGRAGQSGDVVLSIDGVAFARINNAFAANENKRIGGSMITST
ncbi:hypothetical protein KZ483_24065 [Paenibacillus sp. sptzw28]|uniref:hypothetical protein n=1 Tax=Paenibacillus sp. sptzw28 TaxID=715179 RepID=UPI001C6E68C4|nr:hypothetical protein [Paenibacillus sp. sptzw28]QYR20799.1 hypothetical protein KZ483_24065 [Paenibacillus sp. sptzw28]